MIAGPCCHVLRQRFYKGRLTYHSIPKGMHEAKMTFELEPNGVGTRLRLVGDAKPAGVLRLMEPLMGLRMRPHLRDLAGGTSASCDPEYPWSTSRR